jgi:hypothetical protein
MRKAMAIVAAAAIGVGVQGYLFFMIVGVWGRSLDPLPPHTDLMPGLGTAVIVVAAGVLGAIGGAVATGVSGSAARWTTILLPALLGAYTAMCDIHRTPSPAVSLVAMTAVGGCVGWIVATVGKELRRVGGFAETEMPQAPPPAR